MVTEETLKTHEMELESRIRNLVWTVSGDYTLKLKPDVERYAKEPDTVLYDTIRQGAFSCYFDREAYSLYLVKKVYSGAAEGELMMLAQLVTEEAVSKRLESERPGVKGFRRRAAERPVLRFRLTVHSREKSWRFPAFTRKHAVMCSITMTTARRCRFTSRRRIWRVCFRLK